MKASWNGTVIAESDDIVRVDGNAYFPPDALVSDCFQPSSHRTVCGWKGEAHYHDCLLYTSPSPRDVEESRMPSSA